MIRKYFAGMKSSGKENIRWRSHEPSRIEAFSDAVFAFTVSLLAFSLEVPKNSEELLNGMRTCLPFLFCFTVIFYIWYAQYKFFRHYGLHDTVTILLNGILLVVILFYVYPLKFMVSGWLNQSGGNVLRVQDVLPVAILYNAGFALVYFLFSLMYANAYAKREELKLSPVEVFETKSYLYDNIALTCVGLVIILVAIIGHSIDVNATFMCFAFYWIIGPVMAILGRTRKKIFKRKFGNIPIEEPELGSE
jgi:uncharacterized membrane protein